MIIEYLVNEHKMLWAESAGKIEKVETRTYQLRERCNVESIMRIIYNHIENFRYDNGYDKPEFLILGVDIYESLSSRNFRELGMCLADIAMDLDIILDYKDTLNIEVRGTASKDFINYIKSKDKKENG